jgi:hypothetical protein
MQHRRWDDQEWWLGLIMTVGNNINVCVGLSKS